MSRERLTIDLKTLGPALQARIDQLGLRHASDFILPILAEALKQPLPTTKPPKAPKVQLDGTVRASLKISQAAHQQLKSKASALGMFSVSEFVEAVATTSSQQDVAPSRLSPEAFQEVSRSNYELRAIGRNVNQIARSLHEFPGKLTKADYLVLAALPEMIGQHTLAVSKKLAEVRPSRTRPTSQKRATKAGRASSVGSPAKSPEGA